MQENQNEPKNESKPIIKAVLDTNVLISSLLTKEGICADIVNLVIKQKILLYYSAEIMSEYKRVLSYPRLSFTSRETKPLLNMIFKEGIAVEAEKSTIKMIDEDDRKFYDLHKLANAILITGNAKHFPKEDSIMKPAAFMEYISMNAG